MTDSVMRIVPSDSRRCQLTVVEKEGVLLDLDSGQIVHLNETATSIWAQHLNHVGDEEIARALSTTFGIAIEAARQDVARALTIPDDFPRFPRRDLAFRIDERGRGVGVTADGPVLELAPTGDSVVVLQTIAPPILEEYLRAIAPKLLTLSGEIVLHASAVAIGSKTVAFHGASGAGKTTTASALGRAGYRVVAEDMLLLREETSGIFTAVAAEQALRTWAHDFGASHGRPGAQIEFNLREYREIQAGPRLTSLFFLDRAQRRGTTFEAIPLSRARTAASLLGNSFASAAEKEAQHALLGRMLKLARIPGYQLFVPAGASALEVASARPLDWLL